MFRIILTTMTLTAAPVLAQDSPPVAPQAAPLVLPWMLLPPQQPTAVPTSPADRPAPPAAGRLHGCPSGAQGHTA